MKEGKIGLIALDLDGTLFTDDKKISDGNLAMLSRATEAGIWVVPTTGRVFKRLSGEIFRIPGLRYIIMTNGSTIMDLKEKRVIYEDLMPMEKVRSLIEELSAFDLMPEASVNGATKVEARFHNKEKLLEYGVPASYIDTVLEWNEPVPSLKEFFREDARVEKMNVFFRDPQERLRAMEYLKKDPSLSVTSSMPRNIEINMVSATKANGLKVLGERLSLQRENIMACGDGLNDVNMIAYAGLGVAMGNAIQEVKDVAEYITDTNEADGVAKAVKKFCF